MADPLVISRRSLLAGLPAAGLLTLAHGAEAAAKDAAPASPEIKVQRPKVAALLTEFRKLSHAEVILDRILEGFGWESQHYRPQLELVSMYVDQFPDGDLSRERDARFDPLKIYPTIAQALTLGGDKLAVDAVLIIGEHGRYKVNEKGQTLYPRYEFFQQTVDVFRSSGRSVPVFNDKHLSWNFDWAREMVDTARKMNFPFWASSSVPITWRLPQIEVPLGAEVTEALAVGNGNPDSYDYHALETLQALVERRKGGETGVKRVQALRGDAVWKAFEAGSWNAGGWDPALFEACLCRSHQLAPAREGFNHVYPTLADLRRMVTDPVAYRIEYLDGTRSTMLLMNGLVGDITCAVQLKGQAEPLSSLFYLGGDHETQPHNFDALVWHIEQFYRTHQLPCPIERNLLATGLVWAGVESLAQGGAVLETPKLAIRYQPRAESIYRRT